MSIQNRSKKSLRTDDVVEESKEPVLKVPPYLTKTAYAILLENECVPRPWHYGGRFGSRTHKIDDSTIGIPLLNLHSKINVIQDIITKRNRENGLNQNDGDTTSSVSYSNLEALLRNGDVELVYNSPRSSNKIPKIELFDATIHPHKVPKDFQQQFLDFLRRSTFPIRQIDSESQQEKQFTFTFSELFCGIGGFGIALDKLGGKCVFACDIYQPSINVYKNNLDTNYLRDNKVAGDIWTVESKDIPPHDLLVGGFPCQPFSSLGKQPGLKDDKTSSGRGKTMACSNGSIGNDQGRGQLFTQIVRVLKEVQPKAFLLENVPGIVTTDNGKALKAIVSELEGAGYIVSYQICSSRGVTAQSRKRLFIVGLIHNEYDQTPFDFPFIPDLQLRAGDVLHQPDELESRAQESFEVMGIPYDIVANICESSPSTTPSSLFRLSDAQMHQLCHRSKSWKPAKLAWRNTSFHTIDSHYGITVGNGNSQLVPCEAPYHPRRLTPRECARIQGFPNSFRLGDFSRERHKNCDAYAVFYTFIKEQYYMIGNAVCPPLIAILGGAVLDIIKKGSRDWLNDGLWRGIELSLQCIAPEMLEAVRQRLLKRFE